MKNIQNKKNKLKEYKEDLIILNNKIDKMREENYKIKIEELSLNSSISKLTKIRDKVLKYKKKIILEGLGCLLISILCFILVSFIGIHAVRILEIYKPQFMISTWLIFFVPFYPISLTMFSNVFGNFFKKRRYIKKNKLIEIEKLLKEKTNKKELNIKKYNNNVKVMNYLKQQKNNIQKEFENIVSTILIDNEFESNNIINNNKRTLEFVLDEKCKEKNLVNKQKVKSFKYDNK